MNFYQTKNFTFFSYVNFFCHVLFKIILISNTYLSNDFKSIVHIIKKFQIIYTNFKNYYTL